MSTFADLYAAGLSTSDVAMFTNEQPEGSYAWGNPMEESITFRVPFGAKSQTFLSIAAGKPTSYTVGGYPVVRLIPLQHPEFPWLLAQEVRFRKFGGQNPTAPGWANGIYGTVAYSHTLFRIRFAAVPYALDGSTPLLTIETQGSGEYVTIPGTAFKFPSDGALLKQDCGVRVSTCAYAVTVFQAPTLNDGVINGYLNNVNSAPFLGWPAGTVLFDSWSSSVSMAANGSGQYQKMFHFLYRTTPHNQLLRPNGAWEAPVDVISGNTLYAASDLGPLLR